MDPLNSEAPEPAKKSESCPDSSEKKEAAEPAKKFESGPDSSEKKDSMDTSDLETCKDSDESKDSKRTNKRNLEACTYFIENKESACNFCDSIGKCFCQIKKQKMIAGNELDSQDKSDLETNKYPTPDKEFKIPETITVSHPTMFRSEVALTPKEVFEKKIKADVAGYLAGNLSRNLIASSKTMQWLYSAPLSSDDENDDKDYTIDFGTGSGEAEESSDASCGDNDDSPDKNVKERAEESKDIPMDEEQSPSKDDDDDEVVVIKENKDVFLSTPPYSVPRSIEQGEFSGGYKTQQFRKIEENLQKETKSINEKKEEKQEETAQQRQQDEDPQEDDDE